MLDAPHRPGRRTPRRSSDYLRDVQDHALRLNEQVDGFRELLENILSVNLTLETQGAQRGLRPAERGGQEDLRVGGDPLRADAGRARSTA